MEMEADFVPVKICPECKKEFKTSYHVFLHYIKGHHRHQTYWYSSFQLGSCYTITLADGAIITKEDGEVILKKFIGNGNFDAPLFNFKRFFQFKSSVDVSFESSQSVDANSTSVRSSIENLEPVDVLNQNYFFDLEMFVFSNIPTVASASKTYSTLDETILMSHLVSMEFWHLCPKKEEIICHQRRDLKLFCEFCGNALKPFRSYTAVVKHEIEEGHVSAKRFDDRFMFYHQTYPSSLRYKYV